MTSRLRIPALLDLMLTDNPATITRAVSDPRLDRDFNGSGPLVNRIIFRRIRRVLRAEKGPVAGVARRDDLDRVRRQDDLQHTLAAILEQGGPAPEQSAALAAWLRSEGNASVPAQVVQEAIGRIFRKDFVSTPETWRAACIVDAAPRNFNPVRRIRWLFAGEPERSRRLLSDSVDGDPAAMHAVAIAVHTLVRSLQVMRDLWRDPNCRSMSPEVAAFRALRAPRSVVRRWSARAATPEGDVGPGTMVVFDLDSAIRRQPGDRLAFMASTWSECPARQWTMALLRSVWAQAKETVPAGDAAGARAPVGSLREAS